MVSECHRVLKNMNADRKVSQLCFECLEQSLQRGKREVCHVVNEKLSCDLKGCNAKMTRSTESCSVEHAELGFNVPSSTLADDFNH